MGFLVHKVAQGSEQWHAARAGVITASVFKVARERLKRGPGAGEPTSKAHDYAFRLAVEQISGQPLDGGFETWQMRRGHELEPAARSAHELHAGVTVEIAGFVTTVDGAFGASADGLIGEDGGAEYKCLISPESLREVLLSEDLSEYMDQVQGGLWITGRKWWDFCVYCPALQNIGCSFSRWRVMRDDDYIFELEKDLLKFKELVLEYKDKLIKLKGN